MPQDLQYFTPSVAALCPPRSLVPSLPAKARESRRLGAALGEIFAVHRPIPQQAKELGAMADFLQVSPNKLVFKFELGKQSGCTITLQVRIGLVARSGLCTQQLTQPRRRLPPAARHYRCLCMAPLG